MSEVSWKKFSEGEVDVENWYLSNMQSDCHFPKQILTLIQLLD